MLAAKHQKIAEDEIELIAKRAKFTANETLEHFEKMNNKIESAPKDIEELTSIRDYMASVPNEIEKIGSDIKTCMSIYEILNQFNYRFLDDEDYDRKWKLFGSPKDTSSRIEKQLQYL